MLSPGWYKVSLSLHPDVHCQPAKYLASAMLVGASDAGHSLSYVQSTLVPICFVPFMYVTLNVFAFHTAVNITPVSTDGKFWGGKYTVVVPASNSVLLLDKIGCALFVI